LYIILFTYGYSLLAFWKKDIDVDKKEVSDLFLEDQ